MRDPLVGANGLLIPYAAIAGVASAFLQCKAGNTIINGGRCNALGIESDKNLF